MTIAQICILLAIAVYLLAMLGVGVWFANKNRSVDDFYLGGRKLGPFVTAMSAEASDMSSWLLMGHKTPWRAEPTPVEKVADEVWLAEKFQSNSDIAGSPRNTDFL